MTYYLPMTIPVSLVFTLVSGLLTVVTPTSSHAYFRTMHSAVEVTIFTGFFCQSGDPSAFDWAFKLWHVIS